MTPATRQLGLVGWPVAHSLSPAMHEAAFGALGLPWRYSAFAVRPVRLAEAVRGAAALSFLGLNVTVPHKEAALALCAPDPLARNVGAVNTLVFRHGEPRPTGLNTDVHGFAALLRETGTDALVPGRLTVVLGAGGAARAVVRVLLDLGAEVAVVSRSPRRVSFRDDRSDLAARLSHHDWTSAALAALLPHASLVVDATPRGLDARPGAAREPADLVAQLSPHAGVLDLVVRRSTVLVDAARAAGLRHAHTGEAMLLHQGVAALEAWSGRPAPVEIMRAALAAALQQSARP